MPEIAEVSAYRQAMHDATCPLSSNAGAAPSGANYHSNLPARVNSYHTRGPCCTRTVRRSPATA